MESRGTSSLHDTNKTNSGGTKKSELLSPTNNISPPRNSPKKMIVKNSGSSPNNETTSSPSLSSNNTHKNTSTTTNDTINTASSNNNNSSPKSPSSISNVTNSNIMDEPKPNHSKSNETKTIGMASNESERSKKKKKGRPSMKQNIENLEASASVHLKQITSKGSETLKPDSKKKNNKTIVTVHTDDEEEEEYFHSNEDSSMGEEEEGEGSNEEEEEEEIKPTPPKPQTPTINTRSKAASANPQQQQTPPPPTTRSARKAKENAVQKSKQLIVKRRSHPTPDRETTTTTTSSSSKSSDKEKLTDKVEKDVIKAEVISSPSSNNTSLDKDKEMSEVGSVDGEEEEETESTTTNTDIGGEDDITKDDDNISTTSTTPTITSNPTNNSNTSNNNNNNTPTTLDLDNSLIKRKKKSKLSDIGPCWIGNCSKADRSLKLLRPLIISTCRTHSIKSESRISDAIKRGDFYFDETGKRDGVCGLCGESIKEKTNYYCANNDCAFAFCENCADIITNIHGNSPFTIRDTPWVCWVCKAVAEKGKEKERQKWIRTTMPTNYFQPATTQKRPTKILPSPNINNNNNNNNNNNKTTPEKDFKDEGIVELSDEIMDNSISPNQSSGNSLNNNLQANSVPTDGVTSLSPTSPSSTNSSQGLLKRPRKRTDNIYSTMKTKPGNVTINQSNNNNQKKLKVYPGSKETIDTQSMKKEMTTFEYFIEQCLNTAKFLSSLPNPTANRDVQTHIRLFYDLILKIKETKFVNNYSLLWAMLEDLSNLIKQNLTVSHHVLSMEEEMAQLDESSLPHATSITRNIPLERSISMIFENHENTGNIGRECSLTKNTLISSMDLAYKSFHDLHQDLELSRKLEEIREDSIKREINELEKQIKMTVDEINSLLKTERSHVDQLTALRNKLEQKEQNRNGLEAHAHELRYEQLKAKNKITQADKEYKTKQSVLDNEIQALNLLIKMVEGLFWTHNYYFDHHFHPAEEIVISKMNEIRKKIELPQPVIPSTKPKPYNLKSIVIYHRNCLSMHPQPEKSPDTQDRMNVVTKSIHTVHGEYAEKLDIFDNPPDVDRRFLMSVHDPLYIKQLEKSIPKISKMDVDNDNNNNVIKETQKQQFVNIDDDYDHQSHKNYNSYSMFETHVSSTSLGAAYKAAGAVCTAVDAVTRSGYTNAFCAIRPPGHHAGRYGRTPDAPTQGLCLVNNVAIGAKYACLTAGYSRIAVFDFDAYHGNGTQEILQSDENFLFISMHVVSDERKFVFPGTGKEREPFHGEVNNVLNIPLKIGSTSEVYIKEFKETVIPKLHTYQPQLLILSAGFNGHRDDPSGLMKLSEEDYYHMTKALKDIAVRYAKGRIISVLEGNYGHHTEGKNYMEKSITAHLRALVEDSPRERDLQVSCFTAFEDVNFLNRNIEILEPQQSQHIPNYPQQSKLKITKDNVANKPTKESENNSGNDLMSNMLSTSTPIIDCDE